MMGVLMARRGKKRRLDLEAEYWRLLASGMGTVEACRQLGIGRKTGYRWREESGGVPPAHLPEASRSDRYLSLLERKRIATLRERGLGVREIAERLGRAPSTVSRELRRNSRRHDNGVYDADLAHQRSRERFRRPRRVKLAADPELKAEVQDKLNLEWSPEQIAAHLRVLWPEQPERHLCHETIYRSLYQGIRGGLSRTLTKRLRTSRPLRKRRRRSDQRAARFIAPPVLIDHRPPAVELRTRLGDWATGRATSSSDPAASPRWPRSSTAAPATSA
ncbi:IS30 family transposase [Streptomyces sp. NPDC057909]|uniref:IS30 family transposase n=1 Tax=Streptomyces sp. NPDC057909 TaxID=3346277 RepID=UPI0036EFDE1A